jgi:hypothetical protein
LSPQGNWLSHWALVLEHHIKHWCLNTALNGNIYIGRFGTYFGHVHTRESRGFVIRLCLMVFECLKELLWHLLMGIVIIKWHSILQWRSCLQFWGWRCSKAIAIQCMNLQRLIVQRLNKFEKYFKSKLKSA